LEECRDQRRRPVDLLRECPEHVSFGAFRGSDQVQDPPGGVLDVPVAPLDQVCLSLPPVST
jgi:hypothetical protein